MTGSMLHNKNPQIFGATFTRFIHLFDVAPGVCTPLVWAADDAVK